MLLLCGIFVLKEWNDKTNFFLFHLRPEQNDSDSWRKNESNANFKQWRIIPWVCCIATQYFLKFIIVLLFMIFHLNWRRLLLPMLFALYLFRNSFCFYVSIETRSITNEHFGFEMFFRCEYFYARFVNSYYNEIALWRNFCVFPRVCVCVFVSVWQF